MKFLLRNAPCTRTRELTIVVTGALCWATGMSVYVPPGWVHAVTNLDDSVVGYGGQPLGTERRTEQRNRQKPGMSGVRGFMFPKHFANTTEQLQELHGIDAPLNSGGAGGAGGGGGGKSSGSGKSGGKIEL